MDKQNVVIQEVNLGWVATQKKNRKTYMEYSERELTKRCPATPRYSFSHIFRKVAVVALVELCRGVCVTRRLYVGAGIGRLNVEREEKGGRRR